MTRTLTQPCSTPAAALVEEPSGSSCQVSVTSGTVPAGTEMHTVDPVIRTLGDSIHPQWVSARRTVAPIFIAEITCHMHSGVGGVVMCW